MGDCPSCEAGGPKTTCQGPRSKETWGNLLAALQERGACLAVPEGISARVASWRDGSPVSKVPAQSLALTYPAIPREFFPGFKITLSTNPCFHTETLGGGFLVPSSGFCLSHQPSEKVSHRLPVWGPAPATVPF